MSKKVTVQTALLDELEQVQAEQTLSLVIGSL